MIKHRNAVEEIKFGRYEHKLETQFILGSIPEWLSYTSGATVSFENNGISFESSEDYTRLCTSNFSAEQMTQISFELFNVNFQSDTADAYIALIKSNNSASIDLFSGGATAGCTMSYHTGTALTGTAAFSDSDVGKIGTITKFRFMKDSAGVARYGNAPRNLRLSIFPVEKEITILENGVPSYTLNQYIHPDGVNTSTIDLSGLWRFEVGFKSGLSLAGAELKIQTNV